MSWGKEPSGDSSGGDDGALFAVEKEEEDGEEDVGTEAEQKTATAASVVTAEGGGKERHIFKRIYFVSLHKSQNKSSSEESKDETQEKKDIRGRNKYGGGGQYSGGHIAAAKPAPRIPKKKPPSQPDSSSIFQKPWWVSNGVYARPETIYFHGAIRFVNSQGSMEVEWAPATGTRISSSPKSSSAAWLGALTGERRVVREEEVSTNHQDRNQLPCSGKCKI